MYKKFQYLLAASALILAAGCGGGGGGDSESAPATGGSSSVATSGTASIAGTVQFSGTAPTPAKIKMDADPKCKLHHPDGAVANDVVVNANGTLQWVFVYVKEGASGGHATPDEPVVLDQKGCTYEPHVFGIMVGQTLKILNSDDTLHNIHSLPKNSRQFNLAMPIQGMELKQKFKSPEVMVRIKCDVHPWMETWCGVLDHPFYSVTDENGAFDIGNLPAGTYTVEAWHEEYGTQTQTVTVGDGATETITLSFGPEAEA